MSELYLIICVDGLSGQDTLYWKPGGNGYTKKIKKAGRFTKEQAERICNAPNVFDYFVLDKESE